MLYLKCTQAVQKILRLKKGNVADAEPSDAALGNWYVNYFPIERRTAFIFMSETTLLSFILLRGRAPITFESFPTMFLAGLEQLLEMKGLSQSLIDKAIKEYAVGFYAKTDSRSDIGSMNDLVNQYQYAVENEGGLARCDLTHIIMGMNQMPQRRLEWQKSWEVAERKLRDV